MKNKNVIFIAASILAVSTPLSHAETVSFDTPELNDIYVGASIGQSEFDYSSFEKDRSFSITGGYKINKNVAIEASYIKLGDFESNQFLDVEIKGFNFSAVGILPVSDKVNFFAKAGMFWWDATNIGNIGKRDGNDISFGFGVSVNGTAVNLSEQFDLVLEYQKLEFDEFEGSNISLGARFNF